MTCDYKVGGGEGRGEGGGEGESSDAVCLHNGVRVRCASQISDFAGSMLRLKSEREESTEYNMLYATARGHDMLTSTVQDRSPCTTAGSPSRRRARPSQEEG